MKFSITSFLIVLSVLFFFPGRLHSQDTNLLSGSFTLEQLGTILLPAEKWHPYPKWSERSSWSRIPDIVRSAHVARAERFLHETGMLIAWTYYLVGDQLSKISPLDCLDLLQSASRNSINVFGSPLIQEIGRCICRAHIHDQYFINHAQRAVGELARGRCWWKFFPYVRGIKDLVVTMSTSVGEFRWAFGKERDGFVPRK